MKTKNFDKKLVLNKKTIAHVVKDELTKVQGGTLAATNSDVFLGATCCTCGTCTLCNSICINTCPFVCGP
jgi:hypothetical protein